jgi:hypothetical protein
VEYKGFDKNIKNQKEEPIFVTSQPIEFQGVNVAYTQRSNKRCLLDLQNFWVRQSLAAWVCLQA